MTAAFPGIRASWGKYADATKFLFIKNLIMSYSAFQFRWSGSGKRLSGYKNFMRGSHGMGGSKADCVATNSFGWWEENCSKKKSPICMTSGGG